MAIHNKGGSGQPYERFHVSETTKDNLSRNADPTRDGLLPAELFAQNELVTPPASSSSSGEYGQYAYDNDYIYYCIGVNEWVRVILELVLDAYLSTEADEQFIFEDGSIWKLDPIT